MKKLLIAFFSIAIIALPSYGKGKKVENIIFMIGDGMGLNQMYAGMTHNGNKLNVEEFPYIGLSKTYSFDNYITDSAAGGTALACGIKTRNGMIGQAPDSTDVKSILHVASENGLATGVVVACTVTHATPASFVAHEPSRKMDKEIAADFLDTNIDVFIGGGRKYFEKSIHKRNLIEELKAKGYQICLDEASLSNVQSGKVAGLLYEDHPGKAHERGNMLPQSTQKALDILSKNKKGFFLMIEGSQIDWGGHQNDTNYLLEEMMDFNKTIAVVLEFAKTHPNTLVVITADHETGGMIIADGNFATGEVTLKFTTGDHTGSPVPVYAYGPGAENFEGIYENITFKDKFIKLYRFKKK